MTLPQRSYNKAALFLGMIIAAIALASGWNAQANQGLLLYSSGGVLHASWVADPNVCLFLLKPTGTEVMIDGSCGKAEAVIPPQPDFSYLYQPVVGDVVLLRDGRNHAEIDRVVITALPQVTPTVPVPSPTPQPGQAHSVTLVLVVANRALFDLVLDPTPVDYEILKGSHREH